MLYCRGLKWEQGAEPPGFESNGNAREERRSRSFFYTTGTSFPLLGRLPKVDLIILEGEKCPSVYVRPSVRPQKVSSI